MLRISWTQTAQKFATPSLERGSQLYSFTASNQNEQAVAKVALGHRQLTVSKAKLKSNQVPALLIVGSNDPLKAAAEATTKLLPKSKLVVLDGQDHVSTEMSPGFRKHIQNFLTANKSNENN